MSSAPPEDRCTWSRCERTSEMAVRALHQDKHECCARCAGSMIMAHWDDHPYVIGAFVVPSVARMRRLGVLAPMAVPVEAR